MIDGNPSPLEKRSNDVQSQSNLSLFRERDFLFFIASRFAATMGQGIQHTALTWQVYEVTGSALQIAFIGLARFIPSLAVSLLGGVIADTRDRRLILGLSQSAILITTVVLLAMTAQQAFEMSIVYVLVALQGLISSFENPARQSALPQIVPPDLFQRAIALAATAQQLSMVLGPMAAGLVIARFGLAPTYLIHIVLIVIGVAILPLVRIRFGTRPRGSVSIAMIKEGLQYVIDKKAVLGAMTLDLFAVIFAGATALLPIYAKDILQVGPEGFGLLSASLAIGSFVTASLMTFAPPIKAAGQAMVLTVAGFSIATVLFGLSTNFALSIVLYALVGVTDQVSVVMRTIIIQMGTPDELRGRVSAVHFVFVGASNQLSQVRAGFVADWTNAVFSVVSGGILCMVVSGIIIWLMPELWRYRTDQTPAPDPAPAKP